jgi:non-ribosomal peptide synthetase component F
MMEEGQRSDLKHLTASMTTATTPAVTIPSTFDGIASKWPNNSAIQFEGSTTLTYAELQRLARRLAGALHHSVKPGQLVPVLLDRSVAQVASILAVQYLRAVYVPIDPSLPEARIEGLLSRISPPVIITIPSVAGRSWQPCPEQQSFNPELFIESTDPEDSTFPLIEVDADDVAAILFTSGSTGQPKGVRLTHRNLLDPIMAFAADESLGPTSRLFQFASCSFDVHMIDIYGTILNGACLCQVSQDKMLGDLAHWIRVMEADTVHLTPSVISMLRPEDVPSLKYMVTCGEPVTQAVVSKWSERVELRNLYGKFRLLCSAIVRGT